MGILCYACEDGILNDFSLILNCLDATVIILCSMPYILDISGREMQIRGLEYCSWMSRLKWNLNKCYLGSSGLGEGTVKYRIV